jgi:hypothetical protein
MLNFAINTNATITRQLIGDENIPLIIIDDFAQSPEHLITYSGDGSLFSADQHDFYPGQRLSAPLLYSDQICSLYLPIIEQYFGLTSVQYAKAILSEFSITVTAPEKLRPIQMVPHFDTAESQQFAIVHYLCEQAHGGTSFYRHKNTGFERITCERLPTYGVLLKQQAQQQRLHENPQYIEGTTELFEQIFSVEAKMNRAIIYPSNALHSGNIRPELGLSNNPKKGRLTISSFIQVK